MRGIVSFFVGLVFAIGLGISGMTQTHIVRGFLDLFGDWNPALIGVMGGAIVVHGVLFALITKRATPLLDNKFHIPTRQDFDWKLVAGSAIFGLGWGWAGICPGPGLVALTSFQVPIVAFVVAMLVGMALFKMIEKKI
jgi:uncharacterized protein